MKVLFREIASLQWRHNGRDSVSNHQPHDCLLNRLFRRKSKKTSKPRVTDLCAGNSPVTGEFPAQMASNAENVFIWWRHHDHGCDYHDMNTAWHENTVRCLLCEETPPVTGWLPHRRTVMEILDGVFVVKPLKQTVHRSVKWDAIMAMWCDCNVTAQWLLLLRKVTGD